MLRLIETDFASAGKPDLGDRTPSRFLHVRTPDAFFLECRNLGRQVVTHEIELVPGILLRGMNRHLRRRQRENQPPVASVHGCKSQDVPEESPISHRILAIYDYVCTKDHELCPSRSHDVPTSRPFPIRSLLRAKLSARRAPAARVPAMSRCQGAVRSRAYLLEQDTIRDDKNMEIR